MRRVAARRQEGVVTAVSKAMPGGKREGEREGRCGGWVPLSDTRNMSREPLVLHITHRRVLLSLFSSAHAWRERSNGPGTNHQGMPRRGGRCRSGNARTRAGHLLQFNHLRPAYACMVRRVGVPGGQRVHCCPGGRAE